MTRRFYELTADRSSGYSDTPFSASELSRSLNLCHDSTPGQDGLPYREFQSHLSWWRAILLLFSPILCSSGTSLLPLGSSAKYRPIALASCALLFSSGWCTAGSHLASAVVSMIARAAFDGEQMFARVAWWTRCGFGMTSILCAPTLDIREAFDTAWVEATLVRLHQAGVTGGMWRTFANFFCGTLSQVRARGEVSLWLTLASRRDVCSHLSCSTSKSTVCSGHTTRFRQVSGSCPNSDFRFKCQLYADDLVTLAESEYDLQLSLTEQPFVPARSRPSCSDSCCMLSLLIAISALSLGVGRLHLISRGSASWAHSEGLPCIFLLIYRHHHVRSSQYHSWCRVHFAQRRWRHHFLGWASGTPSSACPLVHLLLCSADSTRSLHELGVPLPRRSLTTHTRHVGLLLSVTFPSTMQQETLDSLQGGRVVSSGVALIRRATFSSFSNHKVFYDVAFRSSLGRFLACQKVSFVQNAFVFLT